MKKSKYCYFFTYKDQYVGYSWLADDYVSFPLEVKERVKRLLNNPDEVLTNEDVMIFEELLKKQMFIPKEVDEFHYIWDQHKQAIHKDDFLRLIVLPTLSCNLNCPYCYETHDGSKMGKKITRNVKAYIKKKMESLKGLTISWFGGEPLLYPDIIGDVGVFASQISRKSDVEFDSTITTNATLLSEETIQILDEAGVNELQVTIDGSKATHNQTRIPANGRNTYEQIVKNVKNFLDYDPENNLILRVHIHSTDNKEINGIRKLFVEFAGYKGQLKLYFRQLFSSCTEAWDQDLVDETRSLLGDVDDRKDDLMLTLYNEAIEEGFRLYFGKSLSSCYADYDSSWVIRPDGLLHKCTTALEKERSLGRLTENGVKYFWDKYTTWKKRTSDNFDREEIKDCSVFPLSWGKCPYSKYQNPGLTSNCKEIKDSVRTKEKLLGIKSRYATRRQKQGADK